MIRFVPGGPFDQETNLSETTLQNLSKFYGYDQPIHKQYFTYIKHLVCGDFGPSLRYPGYTVNQLLKERIPVSFERACEITGKAKNTMYRYTSQGLIPHYKRGKTVYFFEDELLEWVRNSRIETLLERQDSQDRNILSIQAKSKTIK